jgi:hypothetical protein
MSNLVVTEVGKRPTGSLTRNYKATYQYIGNGKMYIQMDWPSGKNWVEIEDPLDKVDDPNKEYTLRVRMSKAEYSDLQANPVLITPAMLGLAANETAVIDQSGTKWRLNPNGDPFTQ